MMNIARRLRTAGGKAISRARGILGRRRRNARHRRWLERHVNAWMAASPPPAREHSFSILTPVFNTPARYFHEAAASVIGQSYGNFEWILFDNGSDRSETIDALRQYSDNPKIKIIRAEENIGITAGMRQCLEKAAGHYIVPLDHDDLLHPKALEALNSAIVAREEPAFLYSDEDLFGPDGLIAAYCRPDWDPILNLCTSYIFHLCAFDRKTALSLGIYSDDASNYCPDWDSVVRFCGAGHEPRHIPLVLYRWRSHEGSSTNRPNPHKGSLVSQFHILSSYIKKRPSPELYEIQTFPISRGTPEWWIRRKRARPEPIQVGIISRSRESTFRTLAGLLKARYPLSGIFIIGGNDVPYELDAKTRAEIQIIDDEYQTGVITPEYIQTGGKNEIGGISELRRKMENRLTMVIMDGLVMDVDEWPWEAIALRELHPETLLISCRILDRNARVMAGNEIFGFDGIVGCPDRGRKADDPGYFGLALKRHTVSAVHSACFLAEGGFLKQAVAELPECATYSFLGTWLGAAAAAAKARVAFSPMISAISSGEIGPQKATEQERRLFVQRHPSLLSEKPWYSPHFGDSISSAYEIIN